MRRSPRRARESIFADGDIHAQKSRLGSGGCVLANEALSSLPVYGGGYYAAKILLFEPIDAKPSYLSGGENDCAGLARKQIKGLCHIHALAAHLEGSRFCAHGFALRGEIEKASRLGEQIAGQCKQFLHPIQDCKKKLFIKKNYCNGWANRAIIQRSII